jgi:hypothetical protein
MRDKISPGRKSHYGDCPLKSGHWRSALSVTSRSNLMGPFILKFRKIFVYLWHDDDNENDDRPYTHSVEQHRL